MAGGTFPTSVPSYTTVSPSETLATGAVIGHRQIHINEEIDIAALATKLGTGASTAAANQVLLATGTGVTAYGQVTDPYVSASAAIARSKLAAPRASVTHNANQSIANVTDTALALNTETYDTDTIHDTVTNNSRLTCKTAGLYAISGGLSFAANATGPRYAGIRLNGTTMLRWISTLNVGAGDPTNLPVAIQYVLAVNDYVELIAYQGSGGALNVVANAYSPRLEMAQI